MGRFGGFPDTGFHAGTRRSSRHLPRKKTIQAVLAFLLVAGVGGVAWWRAFPASAAFLAGEWHLWRGNPDAARLAFHRYLVLVDDKTDHLARFRVAISYLQAREWEEAAKQLEQVLRRDPTHPARVQLGFAYEQLGRDGDALVMYKEAVRLRPKDAYALNALGYFYAQRAVYLDEALSLLHRALYIRPGDGSILDSLGWALYQSGDAAAALAQLRLAVEQVPSSAEVRFHLGVALAKRGMRDQAIVELGKALWLEPRLPGAQSVLQATRAGQYPPMPLPMPASPITP